MIPVLIAIAVITIAAVLAYRWFERYRYTDAWRHSELRGWSFGFLMWFGGLFGHRLPPPPQAKVEFASKDKADNLPAPSTGEGRGGGRDSGGSSLPDDAPHEEQ
ncbi:MAG TPA: hypothetical protein VIT43_02700 [Candidatus Dormibacteraeota bacterium]